MKASPLPRLPLQEAAGPQNDAADPLVSIRDLHITFDRHGFPVRALRGVTLDVMPGEILGLVGESGSGKSVLGMSILGLVRGEPQPKVQGSVLLRGVDMVSAGEKARRELRRGSLGAVFQDPMTSLNPTMRVGQQIEEAAGSTEEAARLLEAVGVPEARKRLRAYPHELSGGQRQRVMIAMAIAGNPALVIADEPTTAVDVTVQAQILELISQLRQDIKCSFLMITHDLGVAAQVADRIAVLYGGRLVELGTASQVLTDPGHPYTVGLLKSRLDMASTRDHQLPALPGEPPDPRAHPPGCPFGPRCSLHLDECDKELPELVAVGRHGGLAACIRVNEVVQSRTALAPTLPWPSRGGHVDEPEVTLRLRAVHKSFAIRSGLWTKHHLQALRGVDLEVKPGESVALVGESGCGKTTLLRMVAGFLRPDSGTVQQRGRTRPQMVFQDAASSLTPWLTAGELIGERLRNEGLSRRQRQQRIADTLRLVGLPSEVASAKPLQLSGGQCQRVALARATVIPPEILLCDEPTSSLDVSLRATVLNLIGRLRRELGLAILFVTHDLAAARVVADRIAVMYLGRIVESGPADEVSRNPAHPYTKALVAAVPGFGAVRVPVKGDPASPLNPPPGCPYHPRCPEAIEICPLEVPALVQFGPDGQRHAACVHVRSTEWP